MKLHISIKLSVNIISKQHENNCTKIAVFCLKAIPRQILKKPIFPRQKPRQLPTAQVNFAGWLGKEVESENVTYSFI